MQVINGKTCAAALLDELKPIILRFQSKYHRSPRLKIIRINDDFGSIVYTKRKIKTANLIGVEADITILPKSTDEDEVLNVIKGFNHDDSIDGVIIQLPLPQHLSKDRLLDEILPEKDVDGISRNSLGSLIRGQSTFMPCTPQGLIRLIQSINLDVKGLNVVILGQSLIVGRPAALVFLNLGATVTVCHSATQDLEAKINTADVLISAMGAAGVVDSKWIKPGATVLDVAINRNASDEIIGDIDIHSCGHVGFITPVPGGVGPMTVACLQFNTVLAAIKRVKDVDLLSQLDVI